jgi:hypothetical protein
LYLHVKYGFTSVFTWPLLVKYGFTRENCILQVYLHVKYGFTHVKMYLQMDLQVNVYKKSKKYEFFFFLQI